jgi:hypothetical protein
MERKGPLGGRLRQGLSAMNPKEYKQILGSAAVMTIFAEIVHADSMGSMVVSTQQQPHSMSEAAIMALLGLSVLAVVAFIRWRTRT